MVLLRKLRITVSVAAKIFRVFAQCGGDVAEGDLPVHAGSDPDVETVILLLSLGKANRPTPGGPDDSCGFPGALQLSRDELQKKTCEELQNLCRDAQLLVSGRKGDLVNRLCGVQTEEATDPAAPQCS